MCTTAQGAWLQRTPSRPVRKEAETEHNRYKGQRDDDNDKTVLVSAPADVQQAAA